MRLINGKCSPGTETETEREADTGWQNRREVIGYTKYINNLFMTDQIFGYTIVNMFCS